MKTKYIYIAFLTILCGGSLVAYSNGDGFFKDERYKKMIHAINNDEQIFHAEFELNNEEGIIGMRPFVVSGTNPMNQDVHLTMEKDSELLTGYNYNTYMDEAGKYTHELEDGDYSLLSSIAEIKAGVSPSHEVGRLQVRIKTSIIEELPVDSAYFLSFRIRETTPYEISEEKRNVLFQIYKKNQYASQRMPTYYASSGFMDDAVMPSDSKIIIPLTYNKIRTCIAGQIYGANDTKEIISKNSMVITVSADNQVLISTFDSESRLKVEMLPPDSGPNDGSYGCRNYCNPEEK